MDDTEPQFELYLNSRDDVPNPEELHKNEVKFNHENVEADKIITGYDNLTTFLDENTEKYVTYSERFDEEIEGEVYTYMWREVNVETAPTHEFCHCGAEIQTRSKERIEDVSTSHHVGTGH